MAAKLLMAFSAGLAVLLGLIHLAYTFTSTHLLPSNPALRAAMENAHLSITRETTVFRAWVGFNASHSMALLLFGVVFGYLAIVHTRMLFGATFLLAVGFATLLAFLVLARLYWFSVPMVAVAVALVCYVASIVMARG